MMYVLIFLWITVWEVAGDFTVRAIKARNEKKRAEEALANLAIQRMISNRQSEKVSKNNSDIVYNPFEGIL